MTPFEIAEGNQIIALFMGAKISPNDKIYFEEGRFSLQDMAGTSHHDQYFLKFNSNFDWIMPVLDEISNIDDCTVQIKMNAKFAEVRIVENISNFNKAASVTLFGENTPETYFKAVVLFLNKYNKKSNKYRLGKKQKRAIIEVATGQEVLLFPEGTDETHIERYLNWLNNREEIKTQTQQTP